MSFRACSGHVSRLSWLFVFVIKQHVMLRWPTRYVAHAAILRIKYFMTAITFGDFLTLTLTLTVAYLGFSKGSTDAEGWVGAAPPQKIF